MAAVGSVRNTQVVKVTHVEFGPAGGDAGGAAVYPDPEPTAAIATTVPADDAALARDVEFVITEIPVEARDRDAWVARARAWAKSPDGVPPYRVRLGEDAVVLFGATGAKAVIAAPAAHLEAVRAAVIEFAHYERALRTLETELAEDWKTVQGHLSLIHTVKKQDLRTGDVEASTQKTMARRLRFARLEPHLRAMPDLADPLARAAAKRLRFRQSVDTRLEAVDAQIETCEDVYDMANQRRSEYAHFWRSYKVELAILLVLFLELILIGVDIYLSHFRGTGGE